MVISYHQVKEMLKSINPAHLNVHALDLLPEGFVPVDGRLQFRGVLRIHLRRIHARVLQPDGQLSKVLQKNARVNCEIIVET